MSKQWAIPILVAVIGAVLLKYVIFPNKAEFAIFVSVLKTYFALLVIAVAIIGSLGALYISTKAGQDMQLRAINIWFWATSIVFVTALLVASLYVKLFLASPP